MYIKQMHLQTSNELEDKVIEDIFNNKYIKYLKKKITKDVKDLYANYEI